MTNHAHRRTALANGLLAVLLVVVLAACSRAASRSVVDAADTGPPPGGQPMVTIAAADESVTEGEPVRFTLTATPPPAAPLEVSLRWEQTGSWLDGELPSTRTISEAGTAEVEAATEDDQVDEPNGRVDIAVSSGDGYTVGNPNMATVAVTDRQRGGGGGGGLAPRTAPRRLPVVTIAAADESVPEGEPVRFTLTATPPPPAPLEVSLSWEQTGNWLDGTPPATVTISTDGTAEIETATNDDYVDEPNGEVNVTVNSDPGYAVGDPNKATVAVTDNDPPVVTIAAIYESVTEGQPVRFTLTATPPPPAPLEVSLSWDQAGNWLDGTPPATVTISTDGTAEIETATNDDRDDEPNGEVNVTVNSGRGYRVGDPNKATVAVTDNETSMRVERITPNPMRNPWPCDCGGSKTVTVRVRFDPPTIEQVNYRLMVTEVIMYSISGRFSEVRHFDRTVAAGTSTDEFPVEYPIRDPRGTAQTGNGVDRRYYFGTENQSGYGNGGEKSVSIRWIIYGPARARRASAT